MDLITVDEYENAKVICLKNNTGDLWVSMKDVGVGLGVKSISDLVLKEILCIFWKKRINKRRN